MVKRIRLSKVSREFNVSLDRVVDYLKSKGYEIEASPAAKITSEMYETIYEEFETNKSKRIESKEVNEELKKEKEMLLRAREKELQRKKEHESRRKREERENLQRNIDEEVKNKKLTEEMLNKLIEKNDNHNDTSTKSIGFKNFRRFNNFPKLKLGDITYMVGRNNSGKSTLVKALLLVIDYLQNQLYDTFSFDNVVLEDANIMTFDRALNNKSSDPSIDFELSLNDFEINISLSGQENSTKGNVNDIIVREGPKGFAVQFHFLEDKLKVFQAKRVKTVNVDYEKSTALLKKEIKELNNQINEKDFTTKELLELNDKINRNIKKLEKFKKNIDKDNDLVTYFLETPLKGEFESSSDNYFVKAIDNFIHLNQIKYNNLKQPELKERESIQKMLNNQNELRNWSSRFIETVNSQYFYYIGAGHSKQSALFSIRDKDNSLAQAIHKYKQQKILKGEEEDVFLKKWMKTFEVGDDYDIIMRAGEAYEFWIFDENKKVSLSDKGMGSLQAMTLVLKLASLIRFNKKNKKQVTVLVEEPELNLHPALQSQLTDLFLTINKDYGFDFIVETHSEYVIRRSQLLALENDYLSDQNTSPNPFSIYYFNNDIGPYEMVFKDDGKFERSFGDGFFNEADKLAMKAYKLNLRNKSNG